MNQAVLTSLKERRSVRAFRPDQIRPEELEAVLEAGTYAPTGLGRQSPLIVATQNPALIARLSKLNAAVMGRDTDPFYGAPTLLTVFADPSFVTGFEDACLVMGNLLNAAFAVGLGSCWIHRAKEVFASADGQALMAEWGVPSNRVAVGHVILGYPATAFPPAAPRREGYVLRVK